MKYDADRGTIKIEVLGDSKLLIDLASGKSIIANLVLSFVMSRVVDIKRRFESRFFLHIY